MRTIRDILGAFLFGLLLLWATTAHACFYGSASYVGASYASYNACYAPSVVVVPQVAYVAAYAYVPAVQYQAPAAYTAVQSYAAPCPPVAEVQAPAYAAPVAVTVQETQQLQTYALPQAVSYLTTNYGCSADVALHTLRIIGHHEAVGFRGRADTLIVHERSFGQRSFFRSDVEVRAPGVRVEAGRRGFFANRAEVRQRTVTRSVTRTRTRGRIG